MMGLVIFLFHRKVLFHPIYIDVLQIRY